MFFCNLLFGFREFVFVPETGVPAEQGPRTIATSTSDFFYIRGQDCVYVDKTELLFRIVTREVNVFLARPRKFGKTLLLSTMAEMLGVDKVRKDNLFKGTWVHTHKLEWLMADAQRRTVLRFDLSTLNHFDMEKGLKLQIQQNCDSLGIDLSSAPDQHFKTLLSIIFHSVFDPVVLVDEYDSPVTQELDKTLGKPNDLVKDNLTILKAFFQALKGKATFQFVTGVTKFAMSGLFSGANDRDDITLAPQYSTICGYTRAEVKVHFEKHIALLGKKFDMDPDDVLKKAFRQYNGYAWTDTRDEAKLCNPYALGMLFSKKAFGDWWLEQGTPGWLPKMLGYAPTIQTLKWMDATRLPKFELLPDGSQRFDCTYLLLQTGYLTVAEYKVTKGEPAMRLDFPNQEVRRGFQTLGERVMNDMIEQRQQSRLVQCLKKALLEGDLIRASAVFNMALSAQPHQQFRGGNENLYHSLFHFLLQYGAGFRCRSQASSSAGDTDVEILVGDTVHHFELKVVDAGARSLTVKNAVDDAKKQLKHYQQNFVPDQAKKKIGVGCILVIRKRRRGDQVRQDAEPDAANFVISAVLLDRGNDVNGRTVAHEIDVLRSEFANVTTATAVRCFPITKQCGCLL